jgi:hypothetical protein
VLHQGRDYVAQDEQRERDNQERGVTRPYRHVRQQVWMVNDPG